MTIRMHSLQEAIKKAICFYDGFYVRNQKVDVLSVSEICLSKPELYPADIDESILEKCKGGTITASFRLAYNPRLEGSSRQENLYFNIQIGFEVVNFQNQQFTIKITNNMILL